MQYGLNPDGGRSARAWITKNGEMGIKVQTIQEVERMVGNKI